MKTNLGCEGSVPTLDRDKSPGAGNGTSINSSTTGRSSESNSSLNPRDSRRTSTRDDTQGTDDVQTVLLRTATLPVTTLELFHGTFKTVTIHRTLRPGSSRSAQWAVQIEIQAGWKTGTRLRYKGEGSDIFQFGHPLKLHKASSSSTPSQTANAPNDNSVNWVVEDIEFVIEEVPHPVYRRQGDDLLIDVPITLLEALFGGFNRKIRIPYRRDTVAATGFSNPSVNNGEGDMTHVELTRGHRQGVIQSGEEQVFVGKGMPLPPSRRMKPGTRQSGDLRVVFKVKLPVLSVEQEDILRDVLL